MYVSLCIYVRTYVRMFDSMEMGPNGTYKHAVVTVQLSLSDRDHRWGWGRGKIVHNSPDSCHGHGTKLFSHTCHAVESLHGQGLLSLVTEPRMDKLNYAFQESTYLVIFPPRNSGGKSAPGHVLIQTASISTIWFWGLNGLVPFSRILGATVFLTMVRNGRCWFWQDNSWTN